MLLTTLISGSLMIILTFIALSVYTATLSDIQQVASDLTRQSLRYVDMGNDSDGMCRSLQAEVLPELAGEFAFVTTDRIAGIDCELASDRTRISVRVTYDLDGHYLQRFGRSVGLDIGQVTRAGVMRL